MRVHRSAGKHGVLPEDAVQAADWSLWIEPLDDDGWPRRELRLGFDTHSRLLETVVLVFESEGRVGDPCHACAQAVLGSPALNFAQPRIGSDRLPACELRPGLPLVLGSLRGD